MSEQMIADCEAVLVAVAEHVTPEEAQMAAEAEERSELERRRLEVAPEALAGDAEALAELERVNAELAALDERQELRALAETEEERREKATAAAEEERRQAVARAKQAEAEAEREEALAEFERTFPVALGHAVKALEANRRASRFAYEASPASGGVYYTRSRLHAEIENRLVRLIHEALRPWQITPGVIWGTQGWEPLAQPTTACTVCAREDREAIDAALASGETAKVVGERFGVTRSTLSRHRQHAGVRG